MRNNKILIGVLISILGIGLIFAPVSRASDKNNLLNIIGSEEIVYDDAAQKVALLVSKSKSKVLLKKYENAHSLTDRELVELLKAVGFKGDGLRNAWAIAKAESNGRPFAFNGNIKTGDSSYGIFQINMLGKLGPDRRDKFDLDFNAELFNPVINAQIVYYMTEGGTDWSSWSSVRNGAMKKWINKFPD